MARSGSSISPRVRSRRAISRPRQSAWPPPCRRPAPSRDRPPAPTTAASETDRPVLGVQRAHLQRRVRGVARLHARRVGLLALRGGHAGLDHLAQERVRHAQRLLPAGPRPSESTRGLAAPDGSSGRRMTDDSREMPCAGVCSPRHREGLERPPRVRGEAFEAHRDEVQAGAAGPRRRPPWSIARAARGAAGALRLAAARWRSSSFEGDAAVTAAFAVAVSKPFSVITSPRAHGM